MPCSSSLRGRSGPLHTSCKRKELAQILIVDDDPQVRDVLSKILETRGHEVRTAADGDSGIGAFREQPADLVILDIFMPGKEGLETIRELRKEFGEVRIMAISGRLSAGTYDPLHTAKHFGVAKTLVKPFGADKLIEAVDEVLAD